MSQSIDFTTLSLKDALDLAILIEEEAQERYEEFVDQLKLHHTDEAGRFFTQMAAAEKKHGASLIARRKALFGDAPATVTREMLWDVEAPDYDAARVFMTARQAATVALQCEIKAMAFFATALPHVKDAQVKALFEELKEEEVGHQQLVNALLAKLPADPDVDPLDYADDTVAH